MRAAAPARRAWARGRPAQQRAAPGADTGRAAAWTAPGVCNHQLPSGSPAWHSRSQLGEREAPHLLVGHVEHLAELLLGQGVVEGAVRQQVRAQALCSTGFIDTLKTLPGAAGVPRRPSTPCVSTAAGQGGTRLGRTSSCSLERSMASRLSLAGTRLHEARSTSQVGVRAPPVALHQRLDRRRAQPSASATADESAGSGLAPAQKVSCTLLSALPVRRRIIDL